MKVIIDTNALVYAAKYRIDLFGLLKGSSVVIANLVIEELQMLAKHAAKASDRKAAALALKIMENYSFMAAELSGSTDRAILELAKRERAAVLTNDTELKKSLAKAGVKVLHIRQKKHIVEWT